MASQSTGGQDQALLNTKVQTGTYYISAEHLTVGYDGVPLIEDIEIGVRRGEILTLIGVN